MRIAVLTSHNAHHYALIRALAREHEVALVVFENVGAKRPRLLKRRLRSLGFLHVMNQMFFKVLDVIFLKRTARERRQDILGPDFEWNADAIPNAELIEVESLNTPEMREKLAELKLDAVVVSGTGILGKKMIDTIRPSPIINIHCGITPRYRGTHGAFWAVVNADWNNVGTTVHYIDEGIDTGAILAQGTFCPQIDDNPRTLVLRQYRIGISLMLEVLDRVDKAEVELMEREDLDSRLYSSPTLTAYWRFRKNMKCIRREDEK
jgi:methionyl-tRNA formyltransferase